jgi:hypothetical protein
LGVYAVLRRELRRGNLKLDFFGGLLVGPRKDIEEGGHLVFLQVCLRGILSVLGFCKGLTCVVLGVV